MACPDCRRSFTPRDTLGAWNPAAFLCPGCGSWLTLDRLGWGLLALAMLAAGLVGYTVAVRWRVGALSPLESVVAIALLLATVLLAELLYLGRARFRRL